MALTPAQLTTLKAAILAELDPTFVALRNDGATGAMAGWFNGDTTFIVWRTSVTRREILQNGFDWTRLDNLSVGKARVWTDIFVDGTINPSKDNVRTGIDSVWVGTAQDLAVRAAIYVHCKRPAKRGEKLFATGTGTTLAPGVLDFEGDISNGDIIAALRA